MAKWAYELLYGCSVTLARQHRLLNYLKDGRLELSNNWAERSIKPFVIDRKNFLFAKTPGGARSSAVIFSMLQTAAENRLDPYRYLIWLLPSSSEMNLDQIRCRTIPASMERSGYLMRTPQTITV